MGLCAVRTSPNVLVRLCLADSGFRLSGHLRPHRRLLRASSCHRPPLLSFELVTTKEILQLNHLGFRIKFYLIPRIQIWSNLFLNRFLSLKTFDVFHVHLRLDLGVSKSSTPEPYK